MQIVLNHVLKFHSKLLHINLGYNSTNKYIFFLESFKTCLMFIEDLNIFF
jgi:hypothetical protein